MFQCWLVYIFLITTVSGSTELFKNPDFEFTDVASKWTCNVCTVSASNDTHSGHKAVKISARGEYWSGLQQVVSLQTNTRFYVHAHVKQLNDLPGKLLQTFYIYMETVLNNGSRIYDNIAQDGRVYSKSGWVKLFSYFMFHHTGVREISLRVRGPDPGINFLLDDMTLTEIPENKNWKSEADARIESIRKNNIHFKVNVPAHVALPDMEIQVDLKRHIFSFGSQTTWKSITNYPHYNELFYYMFNWATLSNYYWHSSPPPRHNPDYSNATHALDVLHNHGIPVRAHNLFWAGENHNPDWIKSLSPSQLTQAVDERIQYAVADTRGKVAHWDVMNELTQGHWFEEQTKDPHFSQKVFAKIHKADPSVKLFLNEDHVVSSGTLTSAYLSLAKGFQNTGIYGLGLECHFPAYLPPDPTLVKMRLDELAVTGLPMWVTELDVLARDENTRADWYDIALRMLFSYPHVEGIIFWGFWDVVNHWRGYDASLVSGSGYKVNAAGLRFIDLIYKEWSTHITHSLSSGKQFDVRGFHGDYDVIVKYRGSPIKKQSFTLNKADITVNIDVTSINHHIVIPTTIPPIDYHRPIPHHSTVHIQEQHLGHATSASSSSLSCITRFSPNSGVGDDMYAEVGCPQGYVLTGCSGRSRNGQDGRDGEVMVEHNGYIVCRSYNAGHSTAPTQAIARCCKLSGLKCEYRKSGPSQQSLDQRLETRCLHGDFATGCTSHSFYKSTDGAFSSAQSCIAQNQEAEGRIYSFAACCSAPHMVCKTVTSKPAGDRLGDTTSASCDAGWDLLGCSTFSEDAGLGGAYINAKEECVAVNGKERFYGDQSCTAQSVCCRINH